MIHWQETEQIFEELVTVLEAGGAAVLAVVHAIRGSTYRRPGAKMLILEKGASAGTISGGCLEADLRLQGLDVLKTGVSTTVHYNTSDDEDRVWGLGLGCNGEVDLVLHRWTANQLACAKQILAYLKEGRPFDILFPLVGEGVPRVMENPDDTGVDGFIDHVQPPPWVVVIGAGDDALPLVQLAADIGFRVWVADHRSAYVRPERFPRAQRVMRALPNDALKGWPLDASSFVVIKTHATQKDRDWLARMSETPVRYIGLLGPRERRDALLKTLPEAVKERVYGPAGLDLGGDGMQQVALSMVAEMLAVYAARTPIHLRDRQAAIHQKECFVDGA